MLIILFIITFSHLLHCYQKKNELPFLQMNENYENDPSLPPIHHYLSESEKLLLFGHENNVPKYEVVEPNGVPKYTIAKSRRVRSANITNNFNKSLPHRIHVNFRAFGELFKLRLRRNYRLLSPTFTITEEMMDKDVTDKEVLVGSNCYYHGYSSSHPNSSAAISMCDGMRGVIETSSAIYVINPLPQSVISRSNVISNTSHSHPHIILKKESLDEYHCPHEKKHITLINESSDDYSLNESNKTYSRSRRSTENQALDNINLTVETAVFIDETLYSLMRRTFPADTEQQIVTYVLTIMNAVQLLFKQPSLGRTVDISVVLMDILKQQPRDLSSSDNIDTYLTNFCVWQHKKRLNSRGLTPRWDHALLLSGINMYVVDGLGRKKRHVVGLAPVSGMCNSLNSCTISEGTSFQTVLVAGHEMGHSLGMEHDGSQDGNACDHDNFVMSPTLGAGKTTWSSCSRDYLNKFIRTSQANCILSPSSHINIINQFISNDKLPGQRFNADQQCALRFGSDARHSSLQSLEDICRLVRCDTGSGRSAIAYHAHPALEGTKCGHRRWCREGRCVSQDTAAQSSIYHPTISSDAPLSKSIDGGWTDWSQFSPCASECVTRLNQSPKGVMISTRKCENPMPYNGGKECDGNDKRVKLCDASQICSSYTYRSISVEEYISDTCRAAAQRNSNLEQRGTQYPSFDSSHSCFVWCHKKGGGYMTQGWKMPDGTPCGKENSRSLNRYCVDGECRFFDCNGFSKTHESTEQCTDSSNLLFESLQDQGWGNWYPISKCRYSCLAKAKGFRLVNRDCNSVNSCGGHKESFQLCNDQIDFCGVNSQQTAEEYANEVCQKYRIKYPTLLNGIGRQLSPITTSINSGCVVACQDRIWRDIHYQMDAFSDGKFPFGTDCSFGSGEKAYCLNGKCVKFGDNDLPVDNDIYDRLQVRLLFSQEYLFNNRHRRSASLTFRKSGIQEQTDLISENASWDHRTRMTPSQWQPQSPSRPIRLSSSDDRNQTLSVEPYVWSITLSECDRYCGQGIRNVNVYCHAGRFAVDDSLCDASTKPIHRAIEQCNSDPCIGSWRTEEWSPCSATCGRGFRTRAILCVKQTESNRLSIIDHKYCNVSERPKQLQICSLPQC